MLTYPIDYEATRGKWWIHDTNTGNTAKMSGGSGDWPNDQGTDPGFDANLVPLLAVSDTRPTEIDQRLVRLVGTVQPPDLENNELRTTWAIVDRDPSDKRDVVRNIEHNEWVRHFDPDRTLIELTLLVGALIRKDKNLNVPPPLQAIADAIESKATKIYKNRLKIDAMLAELEAGNDPVLDQDFEEPD